MAVATNGSNAFTVSNQKLWIVTDVVNDAGNGSIPLGSSVAGPVTAHDVLNAAPALNGDT